MKSIRQVRPIYNGPVVEHDSAEEAIKWGKNEHDSLCTCETKIVIGERVVHVGFSDESVLLAIGSEESSAICFPALVLRATSEGVVGNWVSWTREEKALSDNEVPPPLLLSVKYTPDTPWQDLEVDYGFLRSHVLRSRITGLRWSSIGVDLALEEMVLCASAKQDVSNGDIFLVWTESD